MAPHVKGKHPDEYAIGRRLTGLSPSMWDKTTRADIRAIQRADAEQEAMQMDQIEEPEVEIVAMDVPIIGQILRLVSGFSFIETHKLFHAILLRKVEEDIAYAEAVINRFKEPEV